MFSYFFRINLLASLLAMGMLYPHAPLAACECQPNHPINKSVQRLGSRLANRFWNDVKNADVDAYTRQITRNFHGISVNGIYDKCQQITGLQNLTVTSFHIVNLIAARYGNTLEISYEFFAEGEGIVSGPSIDIWHKRGTRWKLISHTYVPFQD